MKSRFSVGLAVSGLAILLMSAGGAWATNVTIADTMGDGTTDGSTWHGGTNLPDTDPPSATVIEDNEVEPGMYGSQAWDLEAVLWDVSKDGSGNILSRRVTLVGGWNFLVGPDGEQKGTGSSGDLFLSTAKPNYGATIGSLTPSGFPNPTIQETFKYEDVLDIDWENPFAVTATTASVNYAVRSLTQNSTLELAAYNGGGQNVGSDPYRYKSEADGSIGAAITTGVATFTNLGYGNAYGLTSGQHYSVTFDIANTTGPGSNDWLALTGPLWSHFTISCGNDDLMGYVKDTSVPEPISMIMLGCLGVGMFGASKVRKSRKAAK
ncbi:MAG: hypothetical protein NTU83_03585 [Candidatus Hydrogenedentes bacterium]|nr:hypothetical protein [Candidatus Hydrogenedentota bacterium]